jgi:hypothetical protein
VNGGFILSATAFTFRIMVKNSLIEHQLHLVLARQVFHSFNLHCLSYFYVHFFSLILITGLFNIRTVVINVYEDTKAVQMKYGCNSDIKKHF